MSNLIKEVFEKESLNKEINERNSIIFCYETYGFLNRDEAIKKIQELRVSDEDIALVTAKKLSVYSIPFSQSTDEQIVKELTMQRDILCVKLAKKENEKN